MSRVIHIKGKLFIENSNIAIAVIKEFKNGIYFKNNQFVFEQYDAYDRISERAKAMQMDEVEQEYLKRHNIYLKKEEEIRLEKVRIAELKIAKLKIKQEIDALELEKERIQKEEEQRIFEEEKKKKRIEESKQIIREEKADLIIANAKKQGYKIKKEIRKGKSIKLVIQQRTY